MNWIWDHLQLIIAVAGAVAWWLNQHKRAQAGEEEAPPPEEPTFADPVLAERTRRIREEIQRKIDQRAKGYASEQPRPARSDVEEPPPVLEEEVVAPPPVVPRRVSARPDAARQAEILEQQASLVEQLRAVKVMKAAVQKRVAFEEATADHTGEAIAQNRLTVLEDLQAPESLRRAFILREVLGPPVALR